MNSLSRCILIIVTVKEAVTFLVTIISDVH